MAMNFWKATPKTTFTLFAFIKKHWYLIILFIVILPSIIESVKVAIETDNPTYPFFLLGKKLLTADAELDKDVDLLRENRAEAIGMEKPTEGIWQSVIYYWKVVLFWYNTIGLMWLILFPYFVIARLVKGRNKSEEWKNYWIAFKWYIGFLFVTNAIIFTYDIIQGNITVSMDPNINPFIAYATLFVKILPFHGIVNFGIYLVQITVGL